MAQCAPTGTLYPQFSLVYLLPSCTLLFLSVLGTNISLGESWLLPAHCWIPSGPMDARSSFLCLTILLWNGGKAEDEQELFLPGIMSQARPWQGLEQIVWK